MNKTTGLFLAALSLGLSVANAQQVNSPESKKTADFYNSLIAGESPKTSLLNLFFTQMPKGADLHHHYSGTIYAETYLDWVKQKNWKISKSTLTIVTDQTSADPNDMLTVDELIANESLYRKLMSAWSDRDYANHYHEQPAPDQNFFDTFGYFEPVSDAYIPDGLQIIKQRAISENVQYIETMLALVGVSTADFKAKDDMISKLRSAKNQDQLDKLLNQLDQFYAKDNNFNSKVDSFVNNVKEAHKGIDDAGFRMRYQTYAVRVLDPLTVYTQLLASFKAAEKSDLIVGVNIVAPENNHTALQDYSLQMMMFNHLNKLYPNVNRALHAGELTLGMVRPEDLLFHIDQALTVAKAQRIGHGVDISYENNSLKTLENLKNNAAVEINLSSNEFILGVKDNEHPYLIYSGYDVPMVISTDDSGVSRNNLSNQYVLLAGRYKPSYDKIKSHVYNSIKYSFLTDKQKEEEIKKLDNRFTAFEKTMSEFISSKEKSNSSSQDQTSNNTKAASK